MALANFKPTIWRARLLANLHKSHVFANVANREYEGEIRAFGDTVKISSIGAVSVSDYTQGSSISYEDLADASTKLLIDQQKYFAFKVEDIDSAQANTNHMDEAMREASYSLADASDSYLAGLYTDAGITVTEGAFDKDDVYDELTEVKEKLFEKNVPADMPLWLVVEPSVYKHMLRAEIATSTDNISTLGQGAVMHTLGFDVYVSNNLTENHSVAGTYRSIAFAEQILDTEALRLEDYFADAVRGLYVYGGKVIRNDELVDCNWTAS